ncbi:MAG: hypothetical protein HY046_14190 [Acidobacteria bacterium]|nr:hypothetical protein [Acidobacteriota bacterium]
MRILVTFAVDAEFASWRRIRDFIRMEETPARMFKKQIGSADVFVLITGMGPKIGEFNLSSAFGLHPDICISSGLAGALKPELRHGEILVASSVTSHQATTQLYCDDNLIRAAVACGAHSVNSFLTVDHLVSSAKEKTGLAQLADAVEMESAIVLAAAEKRNIQRLAVRAVSDVSEDELPSFAGELVGADGNVRIGRVVSQVAMNPAAIPSLVRLGRNSRKAAKELCHFLDRFITSLCRESRQDESVVAAASR